MSRTSRSLTARRLAAVAAIVLIVGCADQSDPASPFTLWTIRPGDRFDSVKVRAQTVGKTDFSCVTVVRPYQHCVARSTGMPFTGVAGRLHLIVDSAGAIVLTQFQRSVGYVSPGIRGRIEQEWKDEVRTLTESWTRADGVIRTSDTSQAIRLRRWMSKDSTFSVSIMYGEQGDTAQLLTLMNDRVIGELRKSARLAEYVLSSAIVLPSANAEEAMTKAVQSAMVVVSGGPTGAPLSAAPATPMTECPLEQADLVTPANEGRDARTNFSEKTASALELAVPIAYPGWKTVFGQQLYLVSPEGTAEHVTASSRHTVESAGVSGLDDVYAFAIGRTRRLDTARRRLHESGNAAACREAAMIVFVRMRAGRVAESVIVPLDDEAVTSQVSEMNFISIGDSRPQLIVEYSATYAAREWYGRLVWRALMPTDPPRIGERNLVGFEKVVRASGDTTGGYVTEARLIGDTLSFQTLEERKGRTSSQHVKVVLEPGRLLRAAALFEQIQ